MQELKWPILAPVALNPLRDVAVNMRSFLRIETRQAEAPEIFGVRLPDMQAPVLFGEEFQKFLVPPQGHQLLIKRQGGKSQGVNRMQVGGDRLQAKMLVHLILQTRIRRVPLSVAFH
ncbi:MAG: hypothetical protein WCP77_07170 [Roseococcus sp.]